MDHRDDPALGFIAVVRQLADAAGPDGMSVREIVDRLDERAFGLAVLIMAIPCLVPGLYGPPQVLGFPMILLGLQMALGRRELWLPETMMRRRVPKSWLEGMAGFAEKRMRWLERLARPRLRPLATGAGERLAGLMIALAALCVIPPITNTIPSLGLALMSVGILQRDGAFTIAGVAIAAGWFALLAAVVAGAIFGVGFAAGWAQENLGWLLEVFGAGEVPPGN